MTLRTITAKEAAALLRKGKAVLVDVREADERVRAHVAGSEHLPLSRVDDLVLDLPEDAAVLFHCASGQRTQENAAVLTGRAGDCEAFAVEGGFAALRRAGLPLVEDRRQPLPLMRQVQITAGALVLLGAAGGVFLHPGFFALCALVGAGLVMAGVIGICPMANALAAMPWNRRIA